MHGDIEIMDKNIGEKGTCFRFNVLLSLCDGETVTDFSTREGLEYGTSNSTQAQGRTTHATSSSSNICSMSPMYHMCNSSPRLEASRVVLFIGNVERRRTCKRFMKSLGIKVKVVKCQKDLFDTLEEIKQKGRRSNGPNSPESSSNFSSSHSTSHNSFSRAKGVPLSFMDGTEYMSPVFKKTNFGTVACFVLIVIDANAGSSLSKLFGIVSKFKKGLLNSCNVVWLDNPHMHRIDSRIIDQNDIVISKPFHGSRLFQVIMLLPEYDNGSVWQSIKKPRTRNSPVHQGEIQECEDSSCYKPLHCKKFLVVEDTKILRVIATNILVSLGATVEQCENGKEAVMLVVEGLKRDDPNSPYDYILMDCQV